MGARRFELRTSPLSGVRSSQLSYAPVSRVQLYRPDPSRQASAADWPIRSGDAGRSLREWDTHDGDNEPEQLGGRKVRAAPAMERNVIVSPPFTHDDETLPR